jgi:hypothetical protein
MSTGNFRTPGLRIEIPRMNAGNPSVGPAGRLEYRAIFVFPAIREARIAKQN